MFFGLFNEMKAMVQSVLAFEKVGKTGLAGFRTNLASFC